MHFLTGQTTNQLSTEFTKSIVPVDSVAKENSQVLQQLVVFHRFHRHHSTHIATYTHVQMQLKTTAGESKRITLM